MVQLSKINQVPQDRNTLDMANSKRHNSNPFGNAGNYHNNCSPEDIIANCKASISNSEAEINRLLSEKAKVEKLNFKESYFKFLEVSLCAIIILYVLYGHWMWFCPMLVAVVFFDESIPGIRELLLSEEEKDMLEMMEILPYAYKCDYDYSIGVERQNIEQMERRIKQMEDILRTRAANGTNYNNSNRGDSRYWYGQDNYQQGNAALKDIGYYYAVLCCSPNATDEEVRSAYRKLAREYHPDRVGAAGLGEHIKHDAEERLKQINEAYGIIQEHRRLK